MHVHAQIDGKTYMYMYRRENLKHVQTYRQTDLYKHTQSCTEILIETYMHVNVEAYNARVPIGWLIETYMYVYANVQTYWLNHT